MDGSGGGNSTGCGGGGTDFHLPDELLAVIPTDPYEQLDLARKITSMAIASRVSRLEAEAGRLRKQVADKDRTIAELNEKVAQLDRSVQDASVRLREALDENAKLATDRDTLAMTSKKLARDLAKLETFKRQLMQSLSDDNLSRVETVDIRTYDHLVPKNISSKDEISISRTSQSLVSGSTNTGYTIPDASGSVGQKYSPFITPRLTPTATPKLTSQSTSPRTYSTAGSPKIISGATSPTKPRYESGALSPWYPPSQQSSAPGSPPHGRSLPGRTPRMDGKEFFRLARNRLSYEQFSAFLANIKELNAHKQSREETLRKAEEIFGKENKDLYISFQNLVYRTMH